MEGAAEGNSVLAARCQGFGKVPGTKGSHSEINGLAHKSSLSAQQLPLSLCTETKGQICYNVVIVHLTAVTMLHQAFPSLLVTLSSHHGFPLTVLFLNFLSSTYCSLVLLSPCNLGVSLLLPNPIPFNKMINI